MAELIYRFSSDCEKSTSIDSLSLVLKYLIAEYGGAKNLAFKLGISKNVINLWQKNIKKPNDENLQKISELAKIRKNIIKNW